MEFPFSGPVAGLFRLNVYLKQDPHLAHPRDVALQIIDANGAVLAESIN
jgi:hypothetical protein